MKFGFIGCGNVACSLSSHLFKYGAVISGFKGKNELHAQEAARLTNSRVFHMYEEIVSQSDIIFLATPDDVIKSVGQEILKTTPKNLLKDKIFCHLSGVHSSDILKDLLLSGSTVASLHPMAAVSSKDFNFSDTYFTLDAQGSKIVPLIETISLYNLSFTKIANSDKILYHSAACILSNYTVTLFNMAQELFEAIHIEPEIADKMLLSLLKTNVTNLENQGAKNALTGPISRGDAATVQLHLAKLKNFPQIYKIYCALAEQTIKIASTSGKIDENSKNILTEVLHHG